MPGSRSLDAAFRIAFRLGFPLARIWWRLTGAQHEGALVAVIVGRDVLLLRSSYRTMWNFPGGTVKRGETPEAAARRELSEEIGLVAPALIPAGEASGTWEGRRDRVHFFELRLDRPPELRLDNREIVAARFVPPEDFPSVAVTAPVAIYLAGSFTPRDLAAGRSR